MIFLLYSKIKCLVSSKIAITENRQKMPTFRLFNFMCVHAGGGRCAKSDHSSYGL